MSSVDECDGPFEVRSAVIRRFFNKRPEPQELVPEAVEFCAQSLGVAVEKLKVSSLGAGTRHYHSQVYFIGLNSPKEPPQFVLKFRVDGIWNPQAEFEGLCKAWRILKGGEPGNRYSVVQPVYYGAQPACLVTQYQPGISLEPIFTRAIRQQHRPSIRLSEEYCRGIADWITLLQTETRVQEADQIIGQWKDSIQTIGQEIERRVPKLKGIVARILNYELQLTPSHLDEIEFARAQRGDCRPANFLSHDGEMVGFDLEGFGYDSMSLDTVAMRNYFVFESAGNRRRREVAQLLWGAYIERIIVNKQLSAELALILLGYLKWLISELLDRISRGHEWNIRRVYFNRNWIKDRLNWILGLSGSIDTDTKYLVDML